jgi:predicted nucleic acid-binding protein
MIVVDASAMVDALLGVAGAEALGRRLFDPQETLHAPHLLDLEVAQVLRRYSARGQLAAQRARDALSDLMDFRLSRYPHTALLPRMWELRANLTTYDAAYVALAEALDAPLLTRDGRLAAAPGHTARIEVV